MKLGRWALSAPVNRKQDSQHVLDQHRRFLPDWSTQVFRANSSQISLKVLVSDILGIILTVFPQNLSFEDKACQAEEHKSPPVSDPTPPLQKFTKFCHFVIFQGKYRQRPKTPKFSKSTLPYENAHEFQVSRNGLVNLGGWGWGSEFGGEQKEQDKAVLHVSCSTVALFLRLLRKHALFHVLQGMARVIPTSKSSSMMFSIDSSSLSSISAKLVLDTITRRSWGFATPLYLRRLLRCSASTQACTCSLALPIQESSSREQAQRQQVKVQAGRDFLDIAVINYHSAHTIQRSDLFFLEHKLFGPHPKPPILGPPEKFMCLISWERTQKGTRIDFFGGIFGVKNGVPNWPFSATTFLVYCFFFLPLSLAQQY